MSSVTYIKVNYQEKPVQANRLCMDEWKADESGNLRITRVNSAHGR
jgi:hypothetical protein